MQLSLNSSPTPTACLRLCVRFVYDHLTHINYNWVVALCIIIERTVNFLVLEQLLLIVITNDYSPNETIKCECGWWVSSSSMYGFKKCKPIFRESRFTMNRWNIIQITLVFSFFFWCIWPLMACNYYSTGKIDSHWCRNQSKKTQTFRLLLVLNEIIFCFAEIQIKRLIRSKQTNRNKN